MIETCFQINQSRTIEACNILLNVFSDQGVREYVEAQINLVWDKLESDIGKFLPFFKAFHMVRPTQTLLLLQEYIEQESYYPFDARTLPFKDDQQGKSVSDDILQILGSFGDHPELPSALDLLLLYYKKRPDLFEQFYSIYAQQFEVNLDSPRLGYFTQSAVVKNLCEAVNTPPEDANLLTLFVWVASHFLKLDVSKTEGGRHNTVSIYTLAIQPDPPVLEYRKMLWSQLYQIYQRGDEQAEIEQMNMIRTCLCFYDLYPLLFTQLSKYLSDISPDLAVYCHPAIFWGKYHMILASPCCVLQTFYIFFFHRKDLLVFIVAVDRPQLYFTRRFFHYIISFTLPGLAGGCRFAKAY